MLPRRGAVNLVHTTLGRRGGDRREAVDLNRGDRSRDPTRTTGGTNSDGLCTLAEVVALGGRLESNDVLTAPIRGAVLLEPPRGAQTIQVAVCPEANLVIVAGLRGGGELGEDYRVRVHDPTMRGTPHDQPLTLERHLESARFLERSRWVSAVLEQPEKLMPLNLTSPHVKFEFWHEIWGGTRDLIGSE
jgi:hypothetical protein